MKAMMANIDNVVNAFFDGGKVGDSRILAM